MADLVELATLHSAVGQAADGVPVSLYLIVIMSALFIRWMLQQERETREEEIRQEVISETGQATSFS